MTAQGQGNGDRPRGGRRLYGALSSMETLLIVDDRFEVSGRGLVLAPDLPLPAGTFQPFGERIVVARPDGMQIETPAEFVAARYRMADGSHRHAISVILPEADREQVPTGSTVRVSASTRARLGERAAPPADG